MRRRRPPLAFWGGNAVGAEMERRRGSNGADRQPRRVVVAVSESDVLVRNSNDPDGPTVRFDLASWQEFLYAVKRGEFDRPARADPAP